MTKKYKIEINILTFILISVLMFGCSVLKDKRYTTHEESVRNFFKKNYHEMEFSKYQGNMDIMFIKTDTIIKLDSLEIVFNSTNSDYLELFRNRLIPSNILYTDTLRKINVCCFEHLEHLKTKKTVRRFKLWKFDGRFINPTEYYFELTNENSDRITDLKTFINGAKLTFISLPLIII